MRSTGPTIFIASSSASSPNCPTRQEPSWCGRRTTRRVAGSGLPSRCNDEREERILVMMKPARAATRRLLPTSPFGPPPLAPPAEHFAVQDQVTHDKYGLGRVVSVDDGNSTLVIDFGTQQVRITMPCAKLSK